MVFDVMVREGYTDSGKMIINTYRVHDSGLSQYLRNVQDAGSYIFSVIPLFRSKIDEREERKHDTNRANATSGFDCTILQR